MKLKVHNLFYKIFGKDILKDINIEIEKGDFVGLIGPNGCGKSTLLKNI
ncbi:ATP-binding cassette domain-containing protein [Clostridium tyrobutyricum]|nr:ABC transporter ATP-binding protein uup [Clostridium tyrobutyricum]